MSDPLIEHFERFDDYAIKVSRTQRTVLDFEVKRVIGEQESPPPRGLWLYEGADESVGVTTVFEEGEPFLSGSIKWDGCSNWDFHTETVMAHFCSRASASSVGRLLDHLYQIANDRLESYEGN